MIRRPPRSTQSRSSAASDVYKRQHLHDRKTWREIRELLRSLRARFGEHLIVVLDNFSPHKKTELQAWVAEHDIELVFTPTYSSWLNLIECQFGALRSCVLNGSDYQSH